MKVDNTTLLALLGFGTAAVFAMRARKAETTLKKYRKAYGGLRVAPKR